MKNIKQLCLVFLMLQFFSNTAIAKDRQFVFFATKPALIKLMQLEFIKLEKPIQQ
jgi:hypothetical protein